MTIASNQKPQNKKAKKGRKPVQNGYVLTLQKGLPNRFPSAPGDQSTINFKFTSLVTIPPATFTARNMIVLGVGTGGSGVDYLSELSLLFNANSQCYTRWMMENLTVEVRATGIGGQANTFIASSYIPSNTGQDTVPASLSEVSQAIHYAESSLGTVGRYTVKPCEYFNDWKAVDNTDAVDKQCGLVQLYGSGGAGPVEITAGVVTVSGTIHFCGLRR